MDMNMIDLVNAAKASVDESEVAAALNADDTDKALRKLGFPKRNPTPSLYQHPLTAIHSLVSAITIRGNHVQLTMFHRQAAC